ncbi:MAG: serine/threonine protein kinase [Gemmatimonadetes bacterium]|nr:serine/threonine protein kinase [Gemmatimonadota bacterium]
MTQSPGFDAARWDEFAEILEEAMALPESEREGYLARRLAGDAAAQREVRVLIASAGSDAMRGLEEWLVRDTPLTAGPVPTGTAIGAYRVIACIGEGGMGEVYRAERVDGAFEQAVAIKVLRAGFGSAELVRRFQSERRILARLTHPGIVGILDGGTMADGRPYLVMPFVEGVSITAWCDAQSASLEQRLALFLDVAAAVQHAHAALVVHRDIKPSNIMVTPAGDIRLLDFGIAKLLADPEDSSGGATRSALRLLTPEHAAPEQVRGEAVSTATDVYGLGVLLYELVSGTRPHRLGDRSMRALEQEILDVVPPAPSVVATRHPWARRLRGDLDRIILQALRKEPPRRYASVGQFADDIARFLKGLPVSAERDRLGYRIRKFVQRNRLAVGAGVSALVVLMSFAVAMTLQARQLARERDRAQRERDTSESVVQLLTSFFSRANPSLTPGGDTLRVQQLLALGDSLVDALEGQPYLQARMWRVLGSAQLSRGRPDEAERALQRAYDGLMRLDGTDSLEAAQLYHELALAVDGRAGRARSLPMFESVVERLSRATGATALEVAAARREVAERAMDRDSARRILEAASQATVMRTANDSMEHAASLNGLANDRYGTGRLREALALFEETVRVLDALLPPDHPTQLLVRGNLATMHRDLGNLDVAEAMSRDLLRVLRAQVTPNPLGEAAAIERLAGTQALRGFLEEAERGYDEALRLQQGEVESAHATIVWNRYSQAVVRGARGRANEAIATLDSVLAMMRRGGFAEGDSLPAMDLRAAYLIEQGRFDAAARELARTRPRLEVVLSPSHPSREAHAQLQGIVALQQRRPDSALAWFDRARRSQRERLPDTHPEVVGNECGRGVAMARLGRRAEALPLLRGACSRYRGYGLHLRRLLRLGADALRELEGTAAGG